MPRRPQQEDPLLDEILAPGGPEAGGGGMAAPPMMPEEEGLGPEEGELPPPPLPEEEGEFLGDDMGAEFPGLEDEQTKREIGDLLSRLFDLLTEGAAEPTGEVDELATLDVGGPEAGEEDLLDLEEEEDWF